MIGWTVCMLNDYNNIVLGLPEFGVMNISLCKSIWYIALFFANTLVINNALYYKP